MKSSLSTASYCSLFVIVAALFLFTDTVKAQELQSSVTMTVESTEIKARPYNAQNIKVHRVADIDVYKLSKYARLLRMTHIVTPYTVASGRSTSATISNWHSYIDRASKQNSIPHNLIQAVIETESGAMQEAVSEKGAQGLMQLMPETQLDLGVADPFDPMQNIDAGTRYLATQIQRYNGDYALALAAYNAGPGNVDKYKGIPPFSETINFVQKVLTRYNALNSSTHKQ